jgi:hypothetical protein
MFPEVQQCLPYKTLKGKPWKRNCGCTLMYLSTRKVGNVCIGTFFNAKFTTPISLVVILHLCPYVPKYGNVFITFVKYQNVLIILFIYILDSYITGHTSTVLHTCIHAHLSAVHLSHSVYHFRQLYVYCSCPSADVLPSCLVTSILLPVHL